MTKTSRFRNAAAPQTPLEKNLTAQKLRTLLRSKPASFWEKAGEKKALALFHAAAQHVPAYKDFLKTHGIKHDRIHTIADFAHVPPTTKENYIKKYPLEARSWGGKLDGQSILAVSSGTSGEPTIWPRGIAQEKEAALIHEFLYTELFDIERTRTLMLIGFPMGMYVSGMATALPSFAAASRHPNLSIVTVGNNKEQALHIARDLFGKYEQIVIVGHPFFVKDVIETGKAEGIEWSKTHLKTMFCSEGFNEVWRSYVASLADVSPAGSIFNTYGSSEFLLVGFENPQTILLRAAAEKDPEASRRMFGTAIVPNLFQYNPLHRYIESHEGDLLITANAGVPLIRFNQHDAGAVIPYESLAKEKSVAAEMKKLKWKPWQLPFVSLYGRSDRTLVFYAANIYPEHIQSVLNTEEYVKALTGKFVMEKKYLPNMDQVMELHIELQKGIPKTEALARSIQETVVSGLEKVNMEYLFLRKNLDKDLVPRIDLREYQDTTHFKPGLKPRFIAQ